MSRGRRQVLQLNEPTPRVLYSNEPTNEMEDDDDDSAGDMPTPERLVTEDMLPNRPGPRIGPGGRFEMDNKVANFLAEIDALDPGIDGEASRSPVSARNQAPSPVPEQIYTPPREKSPVRSKPNAYSNMFVKGTPEFVKKPDDAHDSKGVKKQEPWPEEPKTDWQQLTDEKTNYPYYWNMVTNAVVWDMPAEFSQYLLRQKEYEEKVERGLREGTLDPEQRIKKPEAPVKQEEKKVEEKVEEKSEVKTEPERPSRSQSKHSRRASHSEDSSSDSSDSDGSQSRVSHRNTRKTNPDNPPEVSSSSAESSRAASHDKAKRSATPELPDSTKPDASSKQENNDESMDFDIDDIDKELEMALERKRQELMKLEDKKSDSKTDKDRPSSKDRKKDESRHRDDDRREDRHRRHGKHRDSDRDRDRDRDRKHYHDRDEKKPKLTLKERLRIEMELKMEKERRKKRAIEDLMARELEQTVGRDGGSQKRPRDEKPSKRYRHDDDRGDYRSRDDYGEYSRDYNTWDGREAASYDDRFVPPSHMKAPPPTDEMIAYEEERRSRVVDYGHGRSSRLYDMNGDSDTDEMRSADAREMEIKKLESLQLAELALSKLEFLEVTKKGLSKLQILLVELETRHQDWQAGGLTTNHFLSKLKEANWQLEQYEASAAPAGWACSWDRDYRRYFYTHKLTGKNQWDYPDADDIRVENEKAQDPKKKFVRGKEVEEEISSTSDKGKGSGLDKDILASMALPPPPPPPAEEHPSVKSLQLMYGSSSESDTEEPSSKKLKKEVIEKSDLNTVPLPPDEPVKDKEKKDKHHKKKKKKEKSKKKEKEKSDAGVIGPSAGPASSIFPQLAAQPPPPPPGESTDNVSSDLYNTTTAEAYMASGGLTHQIPTEVPVYGTMDDSQAGLNDQPLEFGSVQEPSGLHPYAQDTENVDSAVISHGPQMTTVSHQPETYSTILSDPSTGVEPISEVTMGDAYAESSTSVVPNTEEKKKKKREKMGSGSISLKKKHVSSMVQKWQKVKKEVELEEQTRQIREAEIRRKLAELE